MTFNPGDVVTVDFPGVTGVKRRPAVEAVNKVLRALIEAMPQASSGETV